MWLRQPQKRKEVQIFQVSRCERVESRLRTDLMIPQSSFLIAKHLDTTYSPSPQEESNDNHGSKLQVHQGMTGLCIEFVMVSLDQETYELKRRVV